MNRKLSAVSAFYQHAARHGVDLGELLTWQPAGRRGAAWRPFLHHISKGKPPARQAIRLKVPRKHPRVLTVGEVQAILDACDRLRDRLLFAVLHGTGMRIGEALGLRHEDWVAAAERQVAVVPPDERQRCPVASRPAADDPGQRRAGAAVCRLPARRVRRPGQRLRVRQPVGRAAWASVDLRRGLRPGQAAAPADRGRLRPALVPAHLCHRAAARPGSRSRWSSKLLGHASVTTTSRSTAT